MKTKIIILQIAFFSFAIALFGQNLSNDKSETDPFPFSFKKFQSLSDINQTYCSQGDSDPYLMKTDKSVKTMWTKTYGGTFLDEGHSIEQTSDGGYIIVGETTSFGASMDVYLIKTNSFGDTLWTKAHGSEENYDIGHSIKQTTDGGYIITGITISCGAPWDDVYLLKTDSLGDTLWTKTYGGENFDAGYSVQQTSDGGYIITGYTESYGAGGCDVWLIKTDELGDTLWTRTYGGDQWDKGQSVQQTQDDGYIIAGHTKSYGSGNADVYLIRTDALGDTLWTKTYGGEHRDEGNSVQQTQDGGYIIAGETYSFGPGDYYSDVYLIKTNENGDTLWTRNYGGERWDVGNSVQQTQDGSYVIAGYTKSYGVNTDYSDVWLIKTDTYGDAIWTRTYGGIENENGNAVRITEDGGYIIVGYTDSFGTGGSDVWLIKTSDYSTPGYINGTVTLSGGNGNVDDVLITAESLITSETYQTNPTNGSYTFEVPDGDYNLTACLDGYFPQAYENIHVESGQVATVNFILNFVAVGITPDNLYFETSDTVSSIINLDNQNNVNLDYTISISIDDEIHHDGPNDNNAIGGMFDEFGWAVRFTPDELSGYYDTYMIKQIKCFFFQSPGDDPVFKIWEGGSYGNPGTEIYSATESNYTIGDWTIHEISNPISLVAGNEYWIGCMMTNIPPESYPSGVDAGPMIPEKGGWIYFMEQWMELNMIGLDYNWNMRAIVSDMWLSCDPISGVIPSNENVDIGLMVDATELDLGDYYADIIVDILPDLATYTIPVHLLKTLTIAPQNLFVTEKAYASWEAPSSKDLLGYNVYLDGSFVEYSTDLFYQYEDLINEQTYVAGVSAVYDEGESEIIEFEFTYILPVLNSPQNLFVTEKAYASWDAPSSKDLLGYNVYLDGDFVEYTTDLFYQYIGLINEQTHIAGVSAVYDEGESEIIEYEFTCIFVGIESNIKPDTELLGNFPNPFNSSTTISFSVEDSDKNTMITVYNFTGQKIKTLISKRLSAGTHQIVWDGTDDSGNAVSSGIYFYEMNHGDKYTGFKKMILMK